MFVSSCYSCHFFKISLKVYTNKQPSTFQIYYLPQINFFLPGIAIPRNRSTVFINPWFDIIFIYYRPLSQVQSTCKSSPSHPTLPWLYSTFPVINQTKSGLFSEKWIHHFHFMMLFLCWSYASNSIENLNIQQLLQNSSLLQLSNYNRYSQVLSLHFS